MLRNQLITICPKLKFLRTCGQITRLVSNNQRHRKQQEDLERVLSTQKEKILDLKPDFNDQLTKDAFKQELSVFQQDLQDLSLAEILQKYEYSIEDALKLNPDEQKRIIVKGFIIKGSKMGDKLKVKIYDMNNLEEISIFMPFHVFESSSSKLLPGSSAAFTGLVFKNSMSGRNSLYCDKVVYANNTKLKYMNKIYHTEGKLKDWFKMRNYPAMKFKSVKLAALAKMRSTLVNEVHQLMEEEQFVHVTTPILTSWPLQKDENAFVVKNNNREDYFYTEVYLNKESDKHLESIVNAIPQIYTLTHSFPPDQTRSKQVANEKLTLEVAQSTDDGIQDLMNQVEYFVKKLTTSLLKIRPKIVQKVRGETRPPNYRNKLENTDFKYIRMTYEESLGLLEKKEISVKYGEPLTLYHRTIISGYFEDNPVFIHDFPYELNQDFDTCNIDNKAQRFELLLGEGLLASRGKVKSNASYEELNNMLKELNYDVNQENVSWYLDLKKKGSAPSTWFSLSLDLFLMACTDMESLRDTILFPRVPKHCDL